LEIRTKSRLLDTIFDAPSSLTGEHEVEIRHIGPDQCLVWYGNVQAILSLEPPTCEFMKKIVSELELLSKKCSCGTGALLVIRSDVSPPSEEARAYIKYELSRSSMLAAAQVVEGTGFQGAAMRSVLTMLQLASGVRYPMKIFDRLNDGAHWLASELKKRAGQAPDPAGLLRAVLTVRQRFLTQRRPPSLVTGRLYQSGS
jgi:hypothetical protein